MPATNIYDINSSNMCTVNSVLTELSKSLNTSVAHSKDHDFLFLHSVLQSSELNALVNVYTSVGNICNYDYVCPVMSTAMQTIIQVIHEISSRCHVSDDCNSLFQLLHKPHIRSLLNAHDGIARKDFYPLLPQLPFEVNDYEDSVKIVQLVKNDEALGATIKTDEESGKIVIARILHGGAADRSGLIHVGDEVIEVNGINVEGKTPNDVLLILQNCQGTIHFQLMPSDSKFGLRESMICVRAHFDYNPENDPYIPCKEAGLTFKRGDILHIVSQDDKYWWQARHQNDRISRAGLIPSRALQERRVIHERTQRKRIDNEQSSSCTAMCVTESISLNHTKCIGNQTKSIMYDVLDNFDFVREMIHTYEEVAKLYPQKMLFRPIVLIGASGVGRNELKRRLLALDTEKYRSPVPYTSREIKTWEVLGREYLFVTREKMELDIESGYFIENGEFMGHLYGTSSESVKSIINSGCVCILAPHPQAIKALRTPQLKPFIIHIRPPPIFEQLKKSRDAYGARSTFDKTNSRGFTDGELREMIRSSERIDYLYGHLCDEELINDNLSETFEKLLVIVKTAEINPLWVPSSWIQ